MQLHLLTPTRIAGGAAGPAQRFAAAMVLRYLPDAALTIVSQQAAAHSAAGRMVSAAQLLEPFLARVSPGDARAALLDAVRGALAIAPEYEARRAELTQAATAVADLFEAASHDHSKTAAWTVGERLNTDIEETAAPLFDLAAALDPTSA